MSSIVQGGQSLKCGFVQFGQSLNYWLKEGTGYSFN